MLQCNLAMDCLMDRLLYACALVYYVHYLFYALTMKRTLPLFPTLFFPTPLFQVDHPPSLHSSIYPSAHPSQPILRSALLVLSLYTCHQLPIVVAAQER
jgi:hypothetical protein